MPLLFSSGGIRDSVARKHEAPSGLGLVFPELVGAIGRRLQSWYRSTGEPLPFHPLHNEAN